jgi:hypothetical protein
MAAVITDIATDLMTVLDAAALTPDPVVKRLYAPKWTMQTEDPLTLFIITTGQLATPVTRSSDQFVYAVNIAVWANIDTTENTSAVDDLLEFTQQVLDVIRSNKQMGGAVLSSIDNAAAYDPDSLENNVFVSVIKAEYTLLR